MRGGLPAGVRERRREERRKRFLKFDRFDEYAVKMKSTLLKSA
jgi:hypothetical protein